MHACVIDNVMPGMLVYVQFIIQYLPLCLCPSVPCILSWPSLNFHLKGQSDEPLYAWSYVLLDPNIKDKVWYCLQWWSGSKARQFWSSVFVVFTLFRIFLQLYVLWLAYLPKMPVLPIHLHLSIYWVSTVHKLLLLWRFTARRSSSYFAFCYCYNEHW